MAVAQESPQTAIDASDVQAVMNAGSETELAESGVPSGIDLLTLIARGGGFMIPIGIMSLLVVALAFERVLSLRQNKIIPGRLIRELNRVADPIDTLQPPAAYQACLDNPSPASSVVGAMLLRAGQPLGEIERTGNETIQREADRCAAPIRWLNLAAAATPLMGLLGTVWGMIKAFHESTTLTAGRSRSEQLSEGIYTALVTTLAGLVVAIPAAIFAQYLENRVAHLFHRIEELAFDIAPGLQRFEGKQRLDPSGAMQPLDAPIAGSEAPAPPPPPPPKNGSRERGGIGSPTSSR